MDSWRMEYWVRIWRPWKEEYEPTKVRKESATIVSYNLENFFPIVRDFLSYKRDFFPFPLIANRPHKIMDGYVFHKKHSKSRIFNSQDHEQINHQIDKIMADPLDHGQIHFKLLRNQEIFSCLSMVEYSSSNLPLF